MRKIHLFTFTIALLLAGCGKSNTEEQAKETAVSEEQELYTKVMDIHDEVMPKMNDLHKLRKQLEEEIKNSPNMAQDKKELLESQISQIKEASESMMQWMRQFNPDDFKTDKETYLKYLNGELEKVTKVKEDMLKALEKKEEN